MVPAADAADAAAGHGPALCPTFTDTQSAATITAVTATTRSTAATAGLGVAASAATAATYALPTRRHVLAVCRPAGADAAANGATTAVVHAAAAGRHGDPQQLPMPLAG